jgi:glycosyltransferase involved in cell wall biosynthesis
MRLTVFTNMPCWPSPQSPSGYASEGGSSLQFAALSELFDATRIVMPCVRPGNRAGEMFLTGKNLSIVPLAPLPMAPLRRRLALPFWLAFQAHRFMGEARRADAVHALVLGDIGALGMLAALAMRKPLFVRHKNDWLHCRTIGERLERRFLEEMAGGRNVVLATGAAAGPPSRRNSSIRWIFSTTLTQEELEANSKERSPPASDDVRLIIVARQEPLKGTHVLLLSLPLIRRDLPCISLDVVGDGSALPRFQQLALELGVQDSVRFHGRVDHAGVLRLLHSADLYCLPTAESEGFPKSVHEAMACGLPVITTPVSVLPQLVGNGCGVIMKERTPEAVAEAVLECLSDPERYRRMSAEALRVAATYSLERWRDTIGDLLEDAWGPFRPGSRQPLASQLPAQDR